MLVLPLIIGIVLLIMGRKLYWLFLGAVGFFFVFDFVSRTFPHQPQNTVLVIALVAGAAGALLAVLLQKVALLVGGFLAGGYFLAQFLHIPIAPHDLSFWVVFAVGGIAGAVLVRLAFSFALIVLSSVAGAGLILRAFHFERAGYSVPLILLALFGFAVQYGFLSFRKPGKKK